MSLMAYLDIGMAIALFDLLRYQGKVDNVPVSIVIGAVAIAVLFWPGFTASRIVKFLFGGKSE